MSNRLILKYVKLCYEYTTKQLETNKILFLTKKLAQLRILKESLRSENLVLHRNKHFSVSKKQFP